MFSPSASPIGRAMARCYVWMAYLEKGPETGNPDVRIRKPVLVLLVFAVALDIVRILAIMTTIFGVAVTISLSGFNPHP